MGLIDVVRQAQSRGPVDTQEAGLCDLKPSWFISQEAPSSEAGNDELVFWRGIPDGFDSSIKLREDQEGRLVAELKEKEDGSLSLSYLDVLLRPYFEEVLTPSPKPNADTNPYSSVNSVSCADANEAHASSEKKRATRTSFPKLLKKVSPFLGQRLLSAILRACLTLCSWDALRAMLDSRALNGNTNPDLIPVLIEHDEASLLCLWMRNVCDPRFSDVLLVLRYFLKTNLRAGKSLAAVRAQWRQTALVAIGRLSDLGRVKEKDEDMAGDNEGENEDDSKMKDLKEQAKAKALLVSAAVDKFQPFELCLHYLVASGHDEAVLASIVCQLDNGEVFKLLRYLKKWLEKYSRQGSLCTLHSMSKGLWVPSLVDILQWVSVILDAHLMSLVLCPDFHIEVRSIQLLIKVLADTGHRFATLVGVTEHLRESGVLPMSTMSHGEDDHVIEYLEI